MRSSLSGRTLVVTGASSGIGRAFVERAAGPGARFVLLARREGPLHEVAVRAGRSGAEVLVQALDLRDEDAASDAARRTLTDVGIPDILFANAGHSIARTVLATARRPDSMTRSLAANVAGPVAHALPLLAAMAERGSGHLIGSSTANARLTVPGWSPYVASKAAWDTWLRTVAAELGPRGVTTTILAFPLVDTQMSAPTMGRRRAMGPGEAAAWVERAIDRRPRRIAPWWLPAAEVVHALAPSATARLIGAFSMRLARE